MKQNIVFYIGMNSKLMKDRIFFFFVLLTVSFFLKGCGFYSFTGASIPPEAETISVSYFPNHAQVIQPALSQRFTETLQDKFMRQTSLNLLESNGDLHFEGAITGYTTQPVSIQAGDVAAQNRLTISVRVIFENHYDPDSSFERTFTRYYDYPSTMSLSQIEDQAIERISEELADDIFNASVVHW